MASQDNASGFSNEPNADSPEKPANDGDQTPVVSSWASSAAPGAVADEKKSRRGVPRNATQVPTRSKKLDRTLKELESAFTGWESLNCAGTNDTSDEEERLKASLAKEAATTNEEFRKKTKKLLSQLREQLAELND